MKRLWASSVAGRTTAADEVALRQLLWRAVFDNHLDEVNRHVTPSSRCVTSPGSRARPADTADAGQAARPAQHRRTTAGSVARVASDEGS
ncbi:hypothetical protein [Kribbella sp. NBC_00889]|uniref:hypothetical protein n=1 Tax=Kribbella sp. NBC_00889 TaxID=2975974 RepID=UPI00386599B1|nr:hypothetical protein OG817_29620 [Kribbella sp. NBC_00889]